jgi:hypothetical protein
MINIKTFENFHDVRIPNIFSFKDSNDSWKNGALWVRINMLKNIGVDSDKCLKLAKELKDMDWEDIKKKYKK